MWQEEIWKPEGGAGGWRQREAGASCRITPKSLDFFPKARKGHARLLEATLVTCGDRVEGLALSGGTLWMVPALRKKQQRRDVGGFELFGKRQAGRAGRLQVGRGGRVEGGDSEHPLVE